MITDTISFWSILGCLIPSGLCTIFLLYHFLFDRNLRRALNNHIIILLLIICLINQVTFYPWMLYYNQSKSNWKRSYTFCVILAFIDWSLYIAHTLLFAWAMIERHILIFHDGWVSTRTRRFFVHYLPLVVLILYWFFFYVVTYFFPPCSNRFRPTSLVCMFPCLYDGYLFSMWDFVAHQIVPIFVITIFSIGLFLRVLWRKNRMRLAVNWRAHRKMTIQALSISSMYCIILLPDTIVYILRNIYNIRNPLIEDFYDCTVFFSYFVILLFPFVCACSLPQLKVRVKNLFCLSQNRRQIVPIS